MAAGSHHGKTALTGIDGIGAAALAGFWLGGFEGADHVNAAGDALDMARASGHLDHLQADHRRAAESGLACVRESIGWRVSEAPGGAIDLSRARRVAQSAQQHGLQVLWSLMHYGIPGDLNLHDDALIDRFERFATEVARVVGDVSPEAPVYTPVNEIGFLAWMASQPGHLHPPNGRGRDDLHGSFVDGYRVKRRLAQATIAAVRAMRRVDPRARFMHVEPVVHVVPPEAIDAAEQASWDARAVEVSSWQWQAWDLLAGRLEPGLGGGADVIDLLGVNHYHSSQWELGTERRLPWHLRDARRRPMSDLLDDVWRRYRRPVVVAETSHVGIGRAAWLNEMASNVRLARQHGVPVQGVCLYPLIDRPDWNEPARWHRSGLWHVAAQTPGLPRVPEFETARALRAWQQDRGDRRRPRLVMFSSRRWGTALHRLQPVAEGLAGRWTVTVIEPARPDAGQTRPGWRVDWQPQGPALDVLVPCRAGLDAAVAAQRWPASADLMRHVRAWFEAHAADGSAPVVWLDAPDAWPLARQLAPRAVVWDHPDLPPPDVRPLLVDCAHAAQGVDLARHAASRQVPPGWAQDEARQWLEGIPRPRIVCLATDLAVDCCALETVVRARPQWHIVWIGAEDDADHALDTAAVPRLHRLGSVPQALLPALLAAADVAWLAPATSPTPAGQDRVWPTGLLDSLAAGLPVVVLGGEKPAHRALAPTGVVWATDADAVLRACDAALCETAEAAAHRQEAVRAWLALRHWGAIVDQVHRCLVTRSTR